MNYQERWKLIDDHIQDNYLTDDDASLIIEEVLDSLVEVGNGTTKRDLHEACDHLFKFRDL